MITSKPEGWLHPPSCSRYLVQDRHKLQHGLPSHYMTFCTHICLTCAGVLVAAVLFIRTQAVQALGGQSISICAEIVLLLVLKGWFEVPQAYGVTQLRN